MKFLKTKHLMGLETRLIGKYFIIMFHFLFDVVNELSVLSLDMQKRTALEVDSVSFKTKFEDIFTHLKTVNGRHLESFLHEAM